MIKTKDQIEKIVKEIHQNIDFSGVVLIKKDDDIIYENSFGYANRSECINNTLQTRFGIASMTMYLERKKNMKIPQLN
ncbi:penicillin-binding protein [Bacillus mycoides]|nr:penicillin-binding protein [Bacillus mycoides]QWH01125.1 penicillin-binding protein [Bacillus mycoides]HDR7622539.1 penicillin-binding protein [Bacillus mycoides]HDR7629393.1 penicillin-binding protein [Bacillus mycoides]